jgi:hypothetical protein
MSSHLAYYEGESAIRQKVKTFDVCVSEHRDWINGYIAGQSVPEPEPDPPAPVETWRDRAIREPML